MSSKIKGTKNDEVKIDFDTEYVSGSVTTTRETVESVVKLILTGANYLVKTALPEAVDKLLK